MAIEVGDKVRITENLQTCHFHEKGVIGTVVKKDNITCLIELKGYLIWLAYSHFEKWLVPAIFKYDGEVIFNGRATI